MRGHFNKLGATHTRPRRCIEACEQHATRACDQFVARIDRAVSLYVFLMRINCNSHRFLIIPTLFEKFDFSASEDGSCSTSPYLFSVSLCLPHPWATPTHATGCEEASMFFDYSLAALVTAALMFYLVFALLKPERF